MSISEDDLRKLESAQRMRRDEFARIANAAGCTVHKKAGKGSSHERWATPDNSLTLAFVNGRRSHVSQQHAAQKLRKHFNMPANGNKPQIAEPETVDTSTPSEQKAYRETHNGFTLSQAEDGTYTAVHQEFGFLRAVGARTPEELKVEIYGVKDLIAGFKESLAEFQAKFSINFIHHNNRIHLRYALDDEPIATINLKRRNPLDVLQACTGLFQQYTENTIKGKSYIDHLEQAGWVTKTGETQTGINGQELQGYQARIKNKLTQEHETYDFFVGSVTLEATDHDMTQVRELLNRVGRINNRVVAGISSSDPSQPEIIYTSHVSGETLTIGNIGHVNYISPSANAEEALEIAAEQSAQVLDFIERQKELNTQYGFKQLYQRIIKVGAKPQFKREEDGKDFGTPFKFRMTYKDLQPVTLDAIGLRDEKDGSLNHVLTKASFEKLETFLGKAEQIQAADIQQTLEALKSMRAKTGHSVALDPLAALVKRGLK